MTRSIRFLVAVTAALVLCASVHATPTAAGTCEARAQAILSALKAGDYARAGSDFDARMRQAVPADKLEQLWGQMLPAQIGAYRHAADASSQSIGQGMTQVVVPLRFEHGWIDMQVTCRNDGTVAGLFLRPGSAPAASGTTAAAPEAGASSIEVPSPAGPLPGTLLLPGAKGPYPAVLLVAGSGPNDRDETLGPNKPLRDLARGLAEHGIASLRYDKRTRVHGAAMAAKAYTVNDEVTDDAVTAARLLARSTHVDPDRVFVLGHSLGALMAPRIGKRDSALAGLILMAAPARLDLNVVLRQMRYIGTLQHASRSELDKTLKPIIAARDALARADPAHPPEGLYFHAPASYWLSLMHYDPIETAATLDMPMLLLQGEDDYQVTMQDDFQAWKEAFEDDGRVTLVSYPGLSHLFMPAGHPPSPADYRKAGHVAPDVIDRISRWVDAH